MLAIIPSLMEHNMVTILVLPLNSLIMDYECCLKAMAIPHQIYASHQDLNTSHNLILVSADRSLTSHWCSMLADLGWCKTIAWIVIDEAYILLISKGYHKSLSFMYDICSEPVPLVLLSMTLPPMFAPLLVTTYQLLSIAMTVRHGTNHPELRYMLEKVSEEADILKCVMTILWVHQRMWASCNCGLVFVPSVDMCLMLAKDQGWHHYVGDKIAMPETERWQAYLDWMQGRKSMVMVAMSAFSTGNENPHIHVVVHADKPYDMLEYIQGQGHAGQDGHHATCHTLVTHMQWRESTQKAGSVEYDNKQAMLDHLFLYGLKHYLWFGVTSYTNRVGMCCLDDEHCPWNICMVTIPNHGQAVLGPPAPAPSSSSLPDTFVQAMDQAKGLKAMCELGMLDKAEWMWHTPESMCHTYCICQVYDANSDVGTAGSGKHPPNRCATMEDKLGSDWNTYKEWRHLLKYHKHHDKICFICHMPQITDGLHLTMSDDEVNNWTCIHVIKQPSHQ